MDIENIVVEMRIVMKEASQWIDNTEDTDKVMVMAKWKHYFDQSKWYQLLSRS